MKTMTDEEEKNKKERSWLNGICMTLLFFFLAFWLYIGVITGTMIVVIMCGIFLVAPITYFLMVFLSQKSTDKAKSFLQERLEERKMKARVERQEQLEEKLKEKQKL